MAHIEDEYICSQVFQNWNYSYKTNIFKINFAYYNFESCENYLTGPLCVFKAHITPEKIAKHVINENVEVTSKYII